MRLEEVLPAFRAGKKIRRRSWDKDASINNNFNSHMDDSDLAEDDWEIVEEKPSNKKIVKVKVKANFNGLIRHYEEYLDFSKDEPVVVEEKPLPQKTKTVWQWRFIKGNKDDKWVVYEKLLNEDEAFIMLGSYGYEKHSGPHEVSIE